ncbi:MAG: signal peptidase II [Candidatus Polarisedimenticolia bacterium]
MNRDVLLRLLYVLTSAAVLGLDQATKLMVVSRLTLHSTLPVVPGFLHLTLVFNRGALFGLFHGMADPWRSTLFTVVPLGAIAIVLVFQYRTTLHDPLTQGGLALILGGAAGNLADRVRLGYVVDFLDVFIGEHHWPAFNVADSAICCGVGLLVLDLLLTGRRPEQVREAA